MLCDCWKDFFVAFLNETISDDLSGNKKWLDFNSYPIKNKAAYSRITV